MSHPHHHPLGPHLPSTRLSTQRACMVGSHDDTDSSYDNHGIGKHHGQVCPHRIIFDREAETPGTELWQEAQEQGGICNDELWLLVNLQRQRMAMKDGNNGYGIRVPHKWDYILDRIFHAAPHEPVCGPYGLRPALPEFPGFGRPGRR